jgi:hypothetical protein
VAAEADVDAALLPDGQANELGTIRVARLDGVGEALVRRTVARRAARASSSFRGCPPSMSVRVGWLLPFCQKEP